MLKNSSQTLRVTDQPELRQINHQTVHKTENKGS